MEAMSFIQSSLIGGAATTAIVQFLKSSIIPIQFEKYPRITAIATSLPVTLMSAYQAHISLTNNIQNIIALMIGTIATATVIYNNLLNKS